ncbi:methionine gamma-lyase [Candidatus Roizmanbacteria bacterium CG11_big_fil_rev_8_21_14_0_20_36_8]|uniref:L-methionine gamma-lyase n=1 Tax=Candidatus Roizmanbacteria bacterium CG11_big_fil_rev_8_21_14_0_20_36_8 TaxID=1974856 RepID=A0A2M6IUT0_9BACT|nr:MAG: methionine gamma-lyase [Candidatus Roizmanbacteria bacterium CG11_big_fil_rev_8_21_14_0_20_36_8]
MKNKLKFSTQNLHVGLRKSEPTFGSVVTPIYPSSTFQFPTAKEGALRFSGKKKGLIYSRFTNPTVYALEKKLAAIENGERALATSSGMAAITLTLLHHLKHGDSIIAHKVIYGGAFEFIAHILPKFGVTVHMVNANNRAEVESKIDKTTKVIYFETPTNPLLEIVDIQKLAEIGKKHGITTIVDNMFAPPPIQYPLDMGIDIVIHSLTKYIGGHSDVIGGAIIGSHKTIDPIFFQSYIFFGPTMSPYTAYFIIRGISTLEVRIRQQEKNALAVAHFLEAHPQVERVFFPGLDSHPQRTLVKRQMNGTGSVLSFLIKGGYKAGEKLVNNVELIALAVSLGCVESLIEHPASMTHSELTSQERTKAGIDDALIRISVGLEDPEDLIYDLKQAFEKV